MLRILQLVNVGLVVGGTVFAFYIYFRAVYDGHVR